MKNASMGRPELTDWAMELATIVAKRSPCPPGKRHGAVIVKDRRVVATGYNGPPASMEHCETCTLETDKMGKDWRTCPAAHAETNAVANAAASGVSIAGATLFVTKEPCSACAAIVKNAGITMVYTPGDLRESITLYEVMQTAMAREQAGKKEYGPNSYMELDLFDELLEELYDQMVYSYLQILKIMKLKKKAKEINDGQNKNV